MYTIGEFSIITRLSIKTLRRYHELELLVPDFVDPDSGYRYYKPASVERARTIQSLRELEFPLGEIQTILAECEDDQDLRSYLLKRSQAIQSQIKSYRDMQKTIQTVIKNLDQYMEPATKFQIEVKTLPEMQYCHVRAEDLWQNIGKYFGQVARRARARITGPALSLCYDEGYSEPAHYSAGFPVSSSVQHKAVLCEPLAGGRFCTLLYQGPYTKIGAAYQKILEYLQAQDLRWIGPTREVYLKGPGLILKGNPHKYLTEVQFPLADPEAG